LKTLNAEFVVSAANPRGFPKEDLAEVAFAGRSNVGKSSLINAITGVPGLAKTSRTPGRTRLINWFAVTAPGGKRYAIVDLPGFGYAKVPKEMQASWRPLVETFLQRRALRGVFLLIDIRRGIKQEEEDLLAWLDDKGVRSKLVLTKIDKVSKAQRLPEARRAVGPRARPILCSADTGDGISDIQHVIASWLG
jgi:GTP-binding protein